MLSTDDFQELLDKCESLFLSTDEGIRYAMLGQDVVYTLDLFGMDEFEKEGIYSITVDKLNQRIDLDVDLLFFKENLNLYDWDCFSVTYKGKHFIYYLNLISTDLFKKEGLKVVDFDFEQYIEITSKMQPISEFLSIDNDVFIENVTIKVDKLNLDNVLFIKCKNCTFRFTSLDLNLDLYKTLIKNNNKIRVFYPLKLELSLDSKEHNLIGFLNFIWDNQIKITKLDVYIENLDDKFFTKFQSHLNYLNYNKNNLHNKLRTDLINLSLIERINNDEYYPIMKDIHVNHLLKLRHFNDYYFVMKLT